MFDEPIITILQAKQFFKAMGCSHFHMFREYPDRFKEYSRLRIPEKMKRVWTQEVFDEYYADIMGNTDVNSLWMWHSNMEKLLTSSRSQTALMKMLEVSQFMRDKVPLGDRIMVAETIIGRTVRSARRGLIYLAYDRNNILAAKTFVELALHFAKYDEKENRGYERSQDAIQLCNEIKRELRL